MTLLNVSLWSAAGSVHLLSPARVPRTAGDSHGRSFPGPFSLVLTKFGRARCRGWRESRLEAAAGQRASGMCRRAQLGFRPACAASVESAHQSGCWLHSRLRFSWLLAPVHVSTASPP